MSHEEGGDKPQGTLLRELRDKIEAVGKAYELEYDGDMGPRVHAVMDTGVDLDDFVMIHAEELTSLLDSLLDASRSTIFRSTLARILTASSRPVWDMLEEIAEALDRALGDSDVTHIESDEEMRELHPVQWACSEINKMLQAPRSSGLANGIYSRDVEIADLKARLKDAEDDVLRLHNEKMKFFERVIELERELAGAKAIIVGLQGAESALLAEKIARSATATLPPEANELAGMARDARRYRFIRSPASHELNGAWASIMDTSCNDSAMDEAIDKAMRGEYVPQGGKDG